MEIIRLETVPGRDDLVRNEELVEKVLGEVLTEKKMSVGTAESCTGGLVAGKIVSIPGSSEYFKGGIVAYSNEVKMGLLGVDPSTLCRYGAVSEQTAVEMVKGAMKALKTDVAVATTGIAGPTGGSAEKPVGTVWVAAGTKDKIITFKEEKDEGREKNIGKTVSNALLLLLKVSK